MPPAADFLNHDIVRKPTEINSFTQKITFDQDFVQDALIDPDGRIVAESLKRRRRLIIVSYHY